MGGAIARGLWKSGRVGAEDIYCADPSVEVLKRCEGVRTATDNRVVVGDADVVIVAVKPRFVASVIAEIKPFLSYERQLFVSIAAGVDFAALCGCLEKDDGELPAMFRVIPNTAIEVKEGVSIISSHGATAEQTGVIRGLFDGLGLTVLVEERFVDAGMALASCGMAYAFRYMRAAVEGAIELGLTAEQAMMIEMQTLQGAVALLRASGRHPEAEIDRVTTPGGITIRGLNAMEEAGFTTAVIKGLRASV